MKIVVISNMYPDEKHPSYGVFVKNFCNILDNIGIEHKNYVMLKSDSKVRKIVGYIKFYIGTAFALLFEKYDLIYVHYASHSSIPVLMAHVFRKKPIYTNVHGSDVVPENASQERMQRYTRKILSISNRIVVPSEYFKEVVSSKYGIDRGRIFVSPSGGISGKVFFKEKDKSFDQNVKLGYVGRISHKKGWNTLLDACSKLTIPYQLIVVGNGPEYVLMRKKAVQLGIDNRISWMDLLPQDELRNIYNRMDVFIFPSEREGESLGLVGLEAMACGTPVIASEVAAMKEYVINGVNGYTFECGNAEDLCRTILRYSESSSIKKNEMGDEAMKTASEYNIEKISIGIKNILREYYD